ncbi:hypothetical protein CEXT_371371, partial [Caerostris extrusa]
DQQKVSYTYGQKIEGTSTMTVAVAFMRDTMMNSGIEATDTLRFTTPRMDLFIVWQSFGQQQVCCSPSGAKLACKRTR